MQNIVRNNLLLLIKELESKAFILKEDVKDLCVFTLQPSEKYPQKDGIYYFPFEGCYLPFELLSDKPVRDFEKNILLDENKRNKYETFRSLRIASSPLLEDSELLTVISNNVRNIIRFKRNKESYIIDYANNLLMREEDYKKILPFEIVEILNKCDLAYIADLIKDDYSTFPIEFFLLAFSDMKKDLKKDKKFMPKYDKAGINGGNKYILEQSEDLFWMGADRESDYIDDVLKLYDFTLNPDPSAISIKSAAGKYYEFGGYLFRLYSDCIRDEKMRQELLSEERYGFCFAKSIDTAFNLGFSLPDENIRLVLGKVKINEKESFYHVWVEYQAKKSKKWYAVDYTGNLIQEVNDYYKLKKVMIINTIPMNVLRGIQSYFEINNPHISEYLILYFAQELLRDLEKNKSLYKGMH